MQYMGSKNRIAKELVPIIQSYINENTKWYMEIFVGGANIIDKIKCDNKIGYDIHKQLIALLKHAQITTNDFPTTISEQEYNKIKNNKIDYDDWYVGLVGFCSTFGAKYFGGFARGKKDKIPRDRSAEAIKNLVKQAPNLKDIKFECCDFRDIPKDEIEGYVIYCDPPYANTKLKQSLVLSY